MTGQAEAEDFPIRGSPPLLWVHDGHHEALSRVKILGGRGRLGRSEQGAAEPGAGHPGALGALSAHPQCGQGKRGGRPAIMAGVGRGPFVFALKFPETRDLLAAPQIT
jgi:hypothetical protein